MRAVKSGRSLMFDLTLTLSNKEREQRTKADEIRSINRCVSSSDEEYSTAWPPSPIGEG
jgi:hypothetical protein